MRGYERAKREEQAHYREKDLRRYERLFENYAYPMNTFKFGRDDVAHVEEFANQLQD